MTDQQFNFHCHYVCPECGDETCPVGFPTLQAFVLAANTHLEEEHPDQPELNPQLEIRPDCSADG